jgi:hypothetical protein
VLSWAVVHRVHAAVCAGLLFAAGGRDRVQREGPAGAPGLRLPVLHDRHDLPGADTSITTAKPARRIALRYALLSYLFGAVVLAMAISLVASLLS